MQFVIDHNKRMVLSEGDGNMFDKAVHQLNEADLLQAVLDQVPEGKNLDYKQALPGNDAKDRVHFLADVTAMANATGGLLLYGITEKRDGRDTTGTPEAVVGLNINPDQEMRRLDSMMSQSIKPRIHGIIIHPIRLGNGNTVLAVRVPRSWNGPHVVDYEKHWRFYIRSAAGNRQMDVDELRASMTLGDSVAQRLHQFRLERLGRIASGGTPQPMPLGAKMVLHILPLSLGDPRSSLDVAEVSLRQDLYGKLLPPHSGANHRTNLDGMLLFSASNGSTSAYVQLFRSGAIEVVDHEVLSNRKGEILYIPSTHLEEGLLRSSGRYFSAFQDIGIDAPVSVSLSLLGVRGYRLATSAWDWTSESHAIDREDLLLPEQLIEDITQSPEVFMRPTFDALWQAGGYTRCQNFDDYGKWHT